MSYQIEQYMTSKTVPTSRAEYLWDANGNMTKDLNKGISNITYNVLNLPERITHSDGHVTYITYAADGRKLNVTYKINRLMVLHDPLEFPGATALLKISQQKSF